MRTLLNPSSKDLAVFTARPCNRQVYNFIMLWLVEIVHLKNTVYKVILPRVIFALLLLQTVSPRRLELAQLQLC